MLNQPKVNLRINVVRGLMTKLDASILLLTTLLAFWLDLRSEPVAMTQQYKFYQPV
jgi:hypothetical protein